MDKKDIYEHLAKIYLGSTPVKKKKTHTKDFNSFIFISIAIIVAVIILLSIFPYNRHKLSLQEPQGTSLVIAPNIVKINYTLEPGKEAVYSIDLNKLDLTSAKALAFSVRKANYKDNIILKAAFNNSLKEKSEISINDIPSYNWQDYKISLAEFKHISKWSGMGNLSFMVEPKSIQEKRGIVYIDNIKIIK